MYSPYFLTMDPTGQALYIGDSGNNVIRSILLSSQSTYPPVLCPSGQAWYSSACTGCCSCSPGNYCPGDNLQYTCPVGTYSTHNTFAPTVEPTVAPTIVIISTYAGTGTPGSSGDNDQASSSQLNAPFGVCADISGNVYIADTGNNKIRKVNSAGIITTFAGTGTVGSSGDTGKATSATLNNPKKVSVDASGLNVYIADTSNNKIRKVNSAGIITTIAGTGTAGSSGDTGVATSALLNTPFGVYAGTNSNIYIADYGNHKIRKVNSAGIITTFAGTGTAGSSGNYGPATSARLNCPRGVGADSNGNIFIADTSNNQIRKVNSAGIITTYAGSTVGSTGDGGSAISAKFFNPFSVSVDINGNVFIADLSNQRIRLINSAGIVSTFAGTGTVGSTGDGGPSTSAGLYAPSDITIDISGNVYIADRANNKIRLLIMPVVPTASPTVQPTTGPSKVLSTSPTAMPFYDKSTCSSCAPGYYSNVAGSLGCIICPAGTYASSASGATYCVSCPIGTYNPTEGASSSDGCLTCAAGMESLAGAPACSFAISTIAGVSGLIGSTGDGGSGVSALLSSMPYGFTTDITGKHGYIADFGNNRVRVLDLTVGTISTLPTSGAITAVLYPSAVAIGGTGKSLFVIDYGNHIIRKIVLSTGLMTRYVGYQGTAGCTTGSTTVGTSFYLNFPRGIVVDNSDNLYIADTSNHRIVMTKNGTTVTSIVAGQTLGAAGSNFGSTGDGGPATSALLNIPYGVALDWYGLLYIADTGNCRVRKVVNGIITTVVGITSQGYCGYAGDGGPASSAVLKNVVSLAFSPTNDMYIADPSNYCVRMMEASSGIITTFAGNCVSQGATGDGPIAYARFSNIQAISFDILGQLYVTDRGNHIIRKISMPTPTTYINILLAPTAAPIQVFPSLKIISTYAGTGTLGSSGDNGQATNAQLNAPLGVCADISGNVYIVDANNYKIRKVNHAGIITTFAGTGTAGSSGDTGKATSATLNSPRRVSVDASGLNVFITDTSNAKIRKVNSAGIITTFAGTGIAGSSGDTGPATSAELRSPFGIYAGTNSNIYIADYGNHKIRKVNSAGIITTFAGTGTAGSSGNYGPATSARLNCPRGVGADSNGNIFIADTSNNQIRKVNSAGIITTYAGSTVGSTGDGGSAISAKFFNPFSVSVDINGNVFIADLSNQRIRLINSAGIVSTFAGTGTAGSTGDGGLSTNAQLNVPWEATVDISGNVYIVDRANNKIRVLRPVVPTASPTQVIQPTSEPIALPSNGIPKTSTITSCPFVYCSLIFGFIPFLVSHSFSLLFFQSIFSSFIISPW